MATVIIMLCFGTVVTQVILCLLKFPWTSVVWRQQGSVSFSSQVKGISQGISILFWLGGFFCVWFFSCWQQRAALPWQSKSCSDSFPVLEHKVVYKKDRNGSYKDEYIFQLVFNTCDYSPLGFLLRGKHKQAVFLGLRHSPEFFHHWAFLFLTRYPWFSHCWGWAVEGSRQGPLEIRRQCWGSL